MFDSVNLDPETERVLIQLASILNSISCNYPEVDFTTLGEIISVFLNNISNIFIKNSNLTQENEELYCKNIELDSLLESFKKERCSELNKSLSIQNSVIEENESLSCEIKMLKEKIANLKLQGINLNENDYSFFNVNLDNDQNLVLSSNANEISQLKEKVFQHEKNTKNIVSKLEHALAINDVLSAKLDSYLLHNKSSTGSQCTNVGKCWLDDSIIQSYFASFNKHPTTVASRTLFIDPSVSEILKLGCAADVNEQLIELKFFSYSYVFCSVSNSRGCVTSGGGVMESHDEGSHWSLLFCDVPNRVAYHLDSVGDLNLKFATNLADSFGFKTKSVNCYQQNNDFECGLSVLINAKLILHYFCPEGNNNCDFVKWFDQCSKPTCCDNSTVVDTKSKVSSHCSANLLIDSKTQTCTPDKLALRLKRVDSNKWKVVKSKKTSKAPSRRPIATETSNRFDCLTSLCPDSSTPHHSNHSTYPVNIDPSKLPYPGHPRKNIKQSKKNHFIATSTSLVRNRSPHSKPTFSLYGDSHVRSLSGILSDKVKDKYSVSGTVMPNAKMEQIIASIRQDKSLSLSPENVIVVVGGTNDVDVTGRCNNFIAELDLLFAEVAQPRILLVGLTTRHDNPSLNSTISKVNKDLLSLSNHHENVDFLSLESITRKFYTRHGLHLNHRGKTIFADLILDALEIALDSPKPALQLKRPVQPSVHVPAPLTQFRHFPTNPQDRAWPRSFTSRDFLGVAQKPPGVPWALYLRGVWGINVRA